MAQIDIILEIGPRVALISGHAEPSRKYNGLFSTAEGIPGRGVRKKPSSSSESGLDSAPRSVSRLAIVLRLSLQYRYGNCQLMVPHPAWDIDASWLRCSHAVGYGIFGEMGAGPRVLNCRVWIEIHETKGFNLVFKKECRVI